MRNYTKNCYINNLILMLIIIHLSCKKGVDEQQQTTSETCKVEKVYAFHGTRTPSDSGIVTYKGDHITKIDFSNHYYEFLYNNGKIVKRINYSKDVSSIYEYDTLFYNNVGEVIKIETYRLYFLRFEYIHLVELEHSSGKLTKAKTYAVENNIVNPNNLIFEYVYNGNNITKVIETDNFFNQYSGTFTYQYDNNKNYFLKHDSKAWLTNYLMQTFFGTDLPIFLSENNVTKILYDNTVMNLSYQTDDKGNLLQFKRDNNPQINYTYRCQ